MAIPPEIEAALIIVAGMWTSELKDVPPKARREALLKWIYRHETILDLLKQKFGAYS